MKSKGDWYIIRIGSIRPQNHIDFALILKIYSGWKQGRKLLFDIRLPALQRCASLIRNGAGKWIDPNCLLNELKIHRNITAEAQYFSAFLLKDNKSSIHGVCSYDLKAVNCNSSHSVEALSRLRYACSAGKLSTISCEDWIRATVSADRDWWSLGIR